MVETEAGVEAIAEALGIVEGQRHERGGDVAVHPAEHDADLLGLIGQIV